MRSHGISKLREPQTTPLQMRAQLLISLEGANMRLLAVANELENQPK